MHILILATAIPRFNHTISGSIDRVLATLLESFIQLGHKCSLATAFISSDSRTLDQTTLEQLSTLGIQYIGDFSKELVDINNNNIFTKLSKLRSVAFQDFEREFPCFSHPQKIVNTLEKVNADVILLFWDTWFEYLVSYMREIRIPVIGYLAKPRYAAPMARVTDEKSSGIFSKIRKNIRLKLLENKRERHLLRARLLSKISNICAIDTAEYNREKISCEYIPNTWPDIFDSFWFEKRKGEEAKRKQISMLGNLSNLNTTGNYYGLSFLAQNILPNLSKQLTDVDWEINICGPGKLPKELHSQLIHPRVNIKGVIHDPDTEMLASPIFLLFNNAGPYTGGYTRSIYVLSSGSCLIAHRSLAKSMPELQHGVNALLGNTAEEIVCLIMRACREKTLRERIGLNARKTYEQNYHPRIIVQKIINMASESKSTFIG